MTSVTGMKDLEKNFQRFAQKTDLQLSDLVGKTAFMVEREAATAIREPSIGKSVTRYTAGGNPYDHIASKEGDAPNTDTGRLINSLFVNHEKNSLDAEVGTNLNYAFFLETVKNRPFLLPAFKSIVGDFSKELKGKLAKVVKKAGK